MGGVETLALVEVEPKMKYHSYRIGILTSSCESRGRTVSGGQFDWGGLLLKSNGGAQRYTQRVWQSRIEHKGISVLNCETH